MSLSLTATLSPAEQEVYHSHQRTHPLPSSSTDPRTSLVHTQLLHVCVVLVAHLLVVAVVRRGGGCGGGLWGGLLSRGNGSGAQPASVFFSAVQTRGGSVCSHWPCPQMEMRSWEGEYHGFLSDTLGPQRWRFQARRTRASPDL